MNAHTIPRMHRADEVGPDDDVVFITTTFTVEHVRGSGSQSVEGTFATYHEALACEVRVALERGAKRVDREDLVRDPRRPPSLPGYRWSEMTVAAPWAPESGPDRLVVGEGPHGIALYDRVTGTIHHRADARPH